MLNISYDHAGSKISCVVTSSNGSFLGIGQLTIAPLDNPRNLEGSTSDIIPNEYVDSVISAQYSSAGADGFIPVRGLEQLPFSVLPTTDLQSSIQPITKPPCAKTSHLTILVLVSGLLGSLFAVLLIIVCLGVMLLWRQHTKKGIVENPNNRERSSHIEMGDIEMQLDGCTTRKVQITTEIIGRNDSN